MTYFRSSLETDTAARSISTRAPAAGELAPELDEIDAGGRRISLKDFRGSPIVLVFSSAHWDPAATEHIEQYNRLIARLPGLAGAHLLRVEHDGAWRALAFADTELSIPVIADGGAELAKRYGVREGPAVFVIDAAGVVRWRHVAGERFVLPDDIALATSTHEMEHASGTWTRREFVATAMAASFAIAFLPFTRRADMQAQTLAGAPPAPADTIPVRLNVNGRDLSLQLEPRVTLLDALRDYAGMPGTKKGCDHGQCGACTVHVDGRRVLSCLTFAVMQQGKPITTIEGLAQSAGASGDALHPMQEAFLTHDGFQCGYCTPGQIMSASAMVKEPWGSEDGDVREAMSGNICRCGAYTNIVAAIQEVRRGTLSTSNRKSNGGDR
ncbi:MAG: [2Fe-2S]-binding protein [Gemmatimonadetes bacterium]|nr:[2Fe-2S]-binding protein [Gemmatimonadota bacterium]